MSLPLSTNITTHFFEAWDDLSREERASRKVFVSKLVYVDESVNVCVREATGEILERSAKLVVETCQGKLHFCSKDISDVNLLLAGARRSSSSSQLKPASLWRKIAPPSMKSQRGI